MIDEGSVESQLKELEKLSQGGEKVGWWLRERRLLVEGYPTEKRESRGTSTGSDGRAKGTLHLDTGVQTDGSETLQHGDMLKENSDELRNGCLDMEAQPKEVLVSVFQLFGEEYIELANMVPRGGSGASTTPTPLLAHYDPSEVTLVNIINPHLVTQHCSQGKLGNTTSNSGS